MPEFDRLFDFIAWIDALLLLLVVVAAAAVVAARSLFAATMLSGLYSLLMALVWVNMAAMDVAFTEAAVGAGISTVLLLGTLAVAGLREKRRDRLHWSAFFVVLATGSALVYGTSSMPAFGDPRAPIHQHVAPRYIDQTVPKVHALPDFTSVPRGENEFEEHVPNLVTAVLASYRGFDTLFEAAVIFTAGATLVLLLRRRSDSREEVDPA